VFPTHPLALFGLVTPLALPCAVAYTAAQLLPLGLAAPAFVLTMAGLAAIGCWLLRSSGLGQLTWRNHVGGWLLPFCMLLGSGQLPRIGTASVLGSSAVGGAVLLSFGLGEPDAPMPWPLLGAWLLDAVLVLYLLTSMSRNHLWRSSAGHRLLRLVGLIVAQVLVSIGLYVFGHSLAAVLVACLPELIVLAAWLLWFGFLMSFGRNVRWN
jgi:hypothetical protein